MLLPKKAFKSEVAWLLTSLEDSGVCTLTVLSEFICYFQFRDMLKTAWWSAKECVWSSRPPLRRQNTTYGSELLMMGRALRCFLLSEPNREFLRIRFKDIGPMIL